MNAILVRLGGETAVSVYGVLMFAEGFIQPLLYGMCDSLQPAVGYNWGARKFSRVRAIEKCCFAASSVVSILSVFVIAGFPDQITRLFVTDAASDIIELFKHSTETFCPHLRDPLVFLCHSKLYAGHRKASTSINDLRIHRPGISGAAGLSLMAARIERHLAEHGRNRCPGCRPVRDHPPESMEGASSD